MQCSRECAGAALVGFLFKARRVHSPGSPQVWLVGMLLLAPLQQCLVTQG
jgi:xanthosine utilization system XapX-like protein